MYGKILLLAFTLLFLSACGSTRTYVAPEFAAQPPETTKEEAYRVFLVGNTSGNPDAALLSALSRALRSADPERTAVVVLGDNTAGGLADSSSAMRSSGETQLRGLMHALNGFEGRVIVLPGEQDWARGGADGLASVLRQERFLESQLPGAAFVPDEGFPGPVEVDLTDRLSLIALDTQWWLHRFSKSTGDAGKYEVEDRSDFVVELHDLLYKNRKKSVLVVGHHPIMSVGEHAGYLPARDHIFPLAAVIPGAYVPLPVIGSLYPLYIRLGGNRQDLNFPEYKALREGLTGAFATHERLVYASAHEPGLQYFKQKPPLGAGEISFVVSGGGSGEGHVGPGAHFASGQRGFAEITYYEDGSEWLTMRDAEGNTLFRTEMNAPLGELIDPEVADAGPINLDETVVLAANEQYDRGPLQRLILGGHNRDVWATPVEVPVLDLGSLRPIKRGGGQQTLSLRLRDDSGNEYVLRSIDKDPSKSIPEQLRGTLAKDVIQDQISSIHPYGAFIVPVLAGAAGVYHTKPQLVFVPPDPRLGVYKNYFGGRMMMLEERPDGDESDRPNFGRSTDVISPQKMYSEIDDDNDHRVDQQFFLRSRLFDILLSDWDRHRDQWRWAAFEPYELDSTLTGEERKRGKIYRPIPRDRDWAFNRMSGLPSLAKHFVPKFQYFDESYGNLKGLTMNGLEQDRRFFSRLTREDFISAAREIRDALTDDVIERAVRTWPKAIYELHGEQIAATLRTRRDALPETAEELYELHARVVDVVGSNKHERFEVEHVGDSVQVVVYKTRKNGDIERPVYRRTFVRGETREIRLYGLAGNDRFEIRGQDRAGIKIRGIGGPDDDLFATNGSDTGARFYDTDLSGEIAQGTHVYSSTDPAINSYEPRAFKHNVTLPVTYFGLNDDDGLFVGGGARIVRHAFRRSPFAAEHVVKGNFAARTYGFNVTYDGHFVERAGPWDVKLSAAYLSPDNIRNFHGLGNETENDDDNRSYYQARFTEVTVYPSLYREIEQLGTLYAGPFVQFMDVRRDADRFVALPQEGVSMLSFDPQWYAGARAGLLVEAVDKKFNPSSGIRWHSDGSVNFNVSEGGEAYSNLNTALSAYYSLSYSPQITLAARVGGAHNFGDFPFYGAVTLGSNSNLRGFRSTRFAGRSSFYQNVDVRIELFKFSTYLALGKAGIQGFVDNGRVWTDGESSDVWHQGYGGGVWFEIFDALVFQGTAGFSEDDRTVNIGVGFLY